MRAGRVSQIALLVINTIFLLLGIAIVAVGIYAVVDGAQYNITNTVATTIIVVGVGVVVFAGFGFVGTWRINRILLYVYIVVIILLLLALLVIGLVAYFNPWLLDQYSSASWDTANNKTKVFIQDTFQCCGFEDPTDRPGSQICPDDLHYSESDLPGCKQGIQEKIQSYINYIAGVGFTLVFILFLGMAFAISLACNVATFDNEYKLNDYT